MELIKFLIFLLKLGGRSGTLALTILLASFGNVLALNGGWRQHISKSKIPSDQISDLKL